ncbi:MAG: hypothetical protein AVDCRST_MAG93-5751 [uncultured Chloroflexia bacterium]|uniref:Uncharacterized protein n=1 Tax=uncultured Chloroflexia bacterium TaxID=1672391 RepID=A0A6J4L329_9CHLR|nr:MAG: hypothetical protein AVDCRST_MAG93-5751 [uncultured Chloroflexia bacterium]
MKHPVNVRAVSSPQPPALHELYEAKLFEQVEMPLDGPY